MLPVIDVPVFDVVLPVSKLKLNYRPVLVKEEKIILLAKESENIEEVQKAVEQILTNCVVALNPEAKLNVNKLPLADVEFLLIKIREKSLGGTQKMTYTCNAVKDDETVCDKRFSETIDFSKLEIEIGDSFEKNKLQINDSIGVKLRPPSYGILKSIYNPSAYDYKILSDVVEFVYDRNQTYKFSDYTEAEISAFFDSWPRTKIEEVYEFIESMPKYNIKINHKCTSCGFEHKITVENLGDFFQ